MSEYEDYGDTVIVRAETIIANCLTIYLLVSFNQAFFA